MINAKKNFNPLRTLNQPYHLSYNNAYFLFQLNLILWKAYVYAIVTRYSS